MADVRQDRGAFLPGFAPGRKSVGVLVAALAVVLVAIALMLNFSRRQTSHSPAVIGNDTPAAGLFAAAAPQPAPAVVAVSADEDEDAAPARKQTTIARAVAAGRPGLAACYQRALVKDDSLVHGKVTVRVSLAASGRVDSVGVNGPAAFRGMQPCLQKTIAKWDFPAAPAAYVTEFPLVMQGSL